MGVKIVLIFLGGGRGGRGVEVNLTCPGFHTELIQIENKSENVYRTIPGRC